MIQLGTLVFEIGRPVLIVFFFLGIAILIYCKKKQVLALRFNTRFQSQKIRSSRYARFVHRIRHATLLLAFLLYTTSAMEVQILKSQQVQDKDTPHLFFLVDVSPSMSIRDIDGKSRWQVLQEEFQKFLGRKGKAQISIVLFATETSVLVPFTSDHDFVLSSLQEVELGALGDHTAISDALILSAEMLSLFPAQEKRLILISDGLQNSGKNAMKNVEKIFYERKIKTYVADVGLNRRAEFSYTSPLDGLTRYGTVEAVQNEVLQDFANNARAQYTKIRSASDLQGFLTRLYFQTVDKIEYRQSTQKEDLSRLFFLLATGALALTCCLGLFVLRSV